MSLSGLHLTHYPVVDICTDLHKNFHFNVKAVSLIHFHPSHPHLIADRAPTLPPSISCLYVDILITCRPSPLPPSTLHPAIASVDPSNGGAVENI